MIAEVTWGAFVPAAFAVSLLPGANQLLGFRNACRFGWAVAMRAVLGRLLALTVMTMLVAAGLGALLTRTTVVFDVVRWVGVAYLVYLAVESWRQSRRVQLEQLSATTPDGLRLAWQEFSVAAANPKALLLFAVLLPQFVRGSGSPTSGLIAVGLAYVLVEAIVATGYACVGARLRSTGVLRTRSAVLNRVTAGCMLVFAALLAVWGHPAHD
jgi:threonine/homoserine/homoserine lactone efflux protein